MGAVLEDEACHEDISIGIGRGMILETVPYDRVYQLNYYRLHRELQLAAINYPV